jgi:hypothetical protein
LPRSGIATKAAAVNRGSFFKGLVARENRRAASPASKGEYNGKSF